MNKPCVLVFAGSDPSGGAGISADIEAIAAQGAHALPIITAITVQDNDRVFGVHPVATDLILQQAQTLADKIKISAIKIGIIASLKNATALAKWIAECKLDVPVILDPVLGSGNGDALAIENAVTAIEPLLHVATLITPNLPELDLLSHFGTADVLIKGGHSCDDDVTNRWLHGDVEQSWKWPRLPGAFHGSGCTLASAIAGQLASGRTMQEAIENAQAYCHRTLENSYSIASGQRIPQRS